MAAQFDEVCITAPDGSSHFALINGDQGFVMHMREPGDAGSTSRNPFYGGSPATTLEYRLSNGQIDDYPASWAPINRRGPASA